MAQFGEGYDAEENLIFIDFSEPLDNALVWAGLGPIGHKIRIEQKISKAGVPQPILGAADFQLAPA